MLMRLVAREGRMIALMGREPRPGEPGGELAMALQTLLRQQNMVMFIEKPGVAGSGSSVCFGGGRKTFPALGDAL